MCANYVMATLVFNELISVKHKPFPYSNKIVKQPNKSFYLLLSSALRTLTLSPPYSFVPTQTSRI